MGRRKIEIQPITHERNRSVTFLKRKNGLFKKAYELGVLCSVDVAVVIFEERAGHHLKLYQYCSGDIHEIIQRHVRYDGEKDTRTPHDFANNANAKLNHDADVDDDEGDDDDDPDSVPTRGNKRRHEPKLKAEYGNNAKLLIPSSGGDMGLNVDMADYHRPMTIPPPPMPLHHSSQLPSAGGGSALPISTERHSSSGRLLPPNGQIGSQKKPRLAPSGHGGNGSKLSGDESSMYNGYLPSPTSAHSTAYRSNGPSSHQLPYNGYMGGVSNSPPQSFLPSTFDFPSSSSRGSNLPRNNGYSQRSSYSQPQDPQLQGMYHQLMRQNHPHGQHSHSSGLHSQQSPDSLLSTFLDNDEHRQPPSTGPQYAPLDWPSHGPSQPPLPPPSQPSQQESGPPGDPSWLDFLSQNASQSGAQQLHMTLPPANGRDGLSWERDRDGEHYSAERGGDLHPDKPSNGGTLMSPRSSRKRPRADSSAADEKRSSPSARAVSGQDKMHDPGSSSGIDKQDK